jgi:autophagy-related protein 11
MESRIAEVIKPLTTLETDFKSKGAFPHLTRLHNLPFAYISLVLEYRWRRQFGGSFASWGKQLNEAIGSMLFPERERRAEMNKDISQLNFITLWGIKESSSIYCDFTIMSGGEALEKLVVDDAMLDGELAARVSKLTSRT